MDLIDLQPPPPPPQPVTEAHPADEPMDVQMTTEEKTQRQPIKKWDAWPMPPPTAAQAAKEDQE